MNFHLSLYGRSGQEKLGFLPNHRRTTEILPYAQDDTVIKNQGLVNRESYPVFQQDVEQESERSCYQGYSAL